MLVALQPGHIGARELSASALVLARTPAGRKRMTYTLGMTVLLAVLLLGAAGAGYAVAGGWLPVRPMAPTRSMPSAPIVAAPAKAEPHEQELEQARLSLRMSEARAQELERQIDALNQRLRESNEQLAFLRTAREGRRKTGDR